MKLLLLVVLVWFLILVVASLGATSLILTTLEFLRLPLLVLLTVALLIGHLVVQLDHLDGFLPVQLGEDNIFEHWYNGIRLVLREGKVGCEKKGYCMQTRE